jgi:glycosyltransferase involved in cell wall biosynthesis
MKTLVVHHFGPDPGTVGGMATVIRILINGQIGADVVDCYPTWKPRARLSTLRAFMISARALARMPTSHVAHVHLSERGSFFREGLLLTFAQWRGLGTVATIHGAAFVTFARRHPHVVSLILRSAGVITCLEQETLDVAMRLAPHVPCEVVPNPVILDDDFVPADQTDELVVFAGEISLRKGADVLYRAWKIVAQQRPEARCLMVGPISDFSPSAAEHFEMRQAVSPLEIKEILRLARVLALPSRAEVVPMVLLEAMSQGRPFVSTPVGGIRELAEVGGILVPVGDEVRLADRLIELLADPAVARRIGERGRRFCQETRSVEIIDVRLRELYSTITVDQG